MIKTFEERRQKNKTISIMTKSCGDQEADTALSLSMVQVARVTIVQGTCVLTQRSVHCFKNALLRLHTTN